MIAKGNTHDNGARLARYITTEKEGELAELWELRGFALRDITDAFRSVHVMAAKGQCRQPFFHVQVRNPEGETLTRAQWNKAIDKIEAMMGLIDQPRAIAAHTDLKTGHEHVHIAWSRIDPETLTARPLPFFKLRLKKASRQLETLFGLTPVPNERRDRIAYAPKRSEEQQSRRLGIVIHDVRTTIKACFENADCGRSFQSALNAQGLLLAKGERRDFIILDHEGGLHAVGKRILGIAAAEIRTHLADLIILDLPSVDQARAKLLMRPSPEGTRSSEIDEMVFQATTAKAAPRRNVTQRGKQGRATGKERRDSAPSILASPQFVEFQNVDEVRAKPSPDEWIGPTGLEVVPPGAVENREAGTPVVADAPATETQTPPARRAIGNILKQQFRVLVKTITGRGQQKPNSKRRWEEIGGHFTVAAGALFRWLERIPLDSNAIAWEPFLWLDWWTHQTPAAQEYQHDHAVSSASDQSLNL